MTQDRYKFRYVFKKGDEIKMAIYDLDVIESKSLINDLLPDGWELISRDFCTGLRYKNGVLIFENDIVKCPVTLNKKMHGEYSIRQVKFKRDEATWVFDGEWCWMTFHGAFGENGDFKGYSEEGVYNNVEIIGTTHQNPELMEGKL